MLTLGAQPMQGVRSMGRVVAALPVAGRKVAGPALG